VPFPDL